MSSHFKQALLTVFIVALLSSEPASGQIGRIRSLPAEPMEREDMPPAPSYVHATSQPLFLPMGGYVSYQINVNAQGQNIVGDAANEPSMTVDPTNPMRMAVGWRQFDSISSNFRQGGYGYSVDGGIHWTVPGVLTTNLFRSDPVLATTKTGVFHYNSLQGSFFSDEFRSINWGQTWSLLGPATGGDKQWITIDPVSSNSGNVYQSWSTAGNNYNGRQFSRSTDGGTTWMDPINIPNQPIWGTLDVAANGDLFLGAVSTTDASFWVMKSSNAKNSSVTPSFDLIRNVSLGGDISWNPPVNPVGLGGQVWVACDRSTSNRVYLCSTTDRTGSNPSDVMFIRSVDSGNTWSAPLRINDDALNGGKYHWFGTMSVAPNGRIDVCWLDTRNDPGNNLSQLYYSYSADGGATFSPNVQVSPQFNPLVGWPQQNKIGDYMAMHSDSSGAVIVYPATFNGEQDIYCVRVNPADQMVAPNVLTYLRGVNVSGIVSSLAEDDGNYLVSKAGFVASQNEAPVQVVVEGTTTVLSPSNFVFNLVAKTSSNVIQQQVALYNFSTNQYETFDTRNLSTSDTPLSIPVTGVRSRFVEQATGKVRAKLSYRATGLVPAVWSSSTDLCSWAITP